MKRFMAFILVVMLAVPAVLAEAYVDSVSFGSLTFTPPEEWEVWGYEDEGYIIQYERIAGAVRYFTYEEIGMSREDFVVEKDGAQAFMIAPLTIDALFSEVIQGAEWKGWLLDCYTENLYYGETCVGTRLHGNTASDVSGNGYYCFVLLVDDYGVLPIFLNSQYPLKDDILAMADECIASITENGEPLTVEQHDRRVMGYFDEANKFRPTLNGRNVIVPADWLAYTATENYLECVSPVGVLKLYWDNYESVTDGLVGMNMDIERVYQYHMDFLDVNIAQDVNAELLTERVMLDDTVPALRYSVENEEHWLAGIVFFDDCEYAWTQLYCENQPGEAEYTALDMAFDIYMQGADYIDYGDTEFIPINDYMCAGNYEMLIKSGWLATPYEGGFDYYSGEVLSSVAYVPLDMLGIPEGALTDEDGNIDIITGHVEPILSNIVNRDYKELFVSAEAVGSVSGQDCAGIVIDGIINMGSQQMEYAMVIICDGVGFVTCHSFGENREEVIAAGIDFLTAVTVYGQPVEYIPFESPEFVFENSVADEDAADVPAELNGRSITLPPGWSVQDIPGSTVFVYDGYPMQAWMCWFDYADEADREWMSGAEMKTNPIAYEYLEYFACSAFGYEDLDADGVEYSKSTIHDGRPLLKVNVPIDGGVLHTYVFFGPHEIALMYSPCVPEAAENMAPQLIEIAEMYFQ